jgi:hypothetical protein
MNKQNKDLSNGSAKSNDVKKVQSFLEEFSWLLSMYSNLDFRTMPKVVKNSFSSSSEASKAMKDYMPVNPNMQFLTGVLPSVFMDDGVFSSAEEIAQFAKSVLRLQLKSYQKKSRYELIGTIVCNTIILNDSDLNELVKALTLLLNKGEKAKKIISQGKRNLFGWNQIIQELAKESSNEQTN